MTEYNRPLTRRGLERSRLILSKAIEIFAEKGYDATTLSDITDIAGGSRSLIYHCFGNKEGLFRATSPGARAPSSITASATRRGSFGPRSR